jgi:serine/threonine protein kinase
MEEKNDIEKKILTSNADETTDVPNYDEDKTDVPEDAMDNDKTEVPDYIYDDDKTDVPEEIDGTASSCHSQMQGVNGESYIIDEKEYVYNSDISTGNTGEADIILVTKDNKPFALKLYKGTHTPNYDIIEKIKELKDSGFFVPIYSYGKCIRKQNKTMFAYELMDYITYPCLNQVSINHDEEIFRKIAVSAAVCIDLCHKKKFIHQDIKPSNFFLTDKEKGTVMLADFGISSLMDENGYCYTRQSGTTTYNAPEMYNAAGNKVRLSTKTDFYSLGIMLMSIWMGENKFRVEMGDKTGKDRIFDLNRKKSKGELPYPTDLSDNLLLLIKGLTVPDEKNRWGFNEIIKWSTGKLMMADMDVAIHDKPFVFNENEGKVAHSPEELAELMNADKAYALKILKRGKVSTWLHNCNRDNTATNIDEIVDNEKTDNACVMMAVYTLDQNFAYFGINNNGCKTLEEIGHDIISRKSNDDMITKIDSDFYCFLRAHGRKDLYDMCLKIVNRNTYNPQWEIAVTLDSNQPLIIDGNDGKHMIFNATAEVAEYFGKMRCVIDKQTADTITSDAFIKWVMARDADAANCIGNQMNAGDSTDRCWCVLYNLDVNRSYELTIEEEEGDCHKSYDDIKEYINDRVIEYFAAGSRIKSKEIRGLFLVNEDNTMATNRLYYYLTSKGKDASEIYAFTSSYFKELDLKKSHRCIKLTEEAAIWKSMKGIMGKDRNPRYHIEKSNKDITSLDDLKKLNEREVRDEITNNYLAAWIGIFFHDNPFADMSKDCEFEKLVNDYVNYIGKIQPAYTPYKKLNQAKNMICRDINELKKSFHSFNIIRTTLLTVYLFALIFLIFGMMKWGISYEIGFVKRNLVGFAITGAIVGSIIGIFSMVIYESKSGMIKRVFISGITVALVMVIVNELMVYVPTQLVHIISAVLIVTSLGLLFRCRKSIQLDSKKYKSLISIVNNRDSICVQPAQFAFQDIYEKYEYEEKQSLMEETKCLKEKTREILQKLAPGVLVFIILTSLFIFITPQLGGKELPKFNYTQLEGIWEGTFEGNAAAIKIELDPENTINATVFVTFNASVKEKFTGVLNTTDNTLQLNDNSDNGILDGCFTGTINKTVDCYKGQYKSKKTGRLFTFKFIRKKK